MKFDNFKIETWDIFPNPCYNPQERYGNAPATFYDLMCDERIPAADRIWAFAKCTLIPDNIKRFAAVRFVRETPIRDGRFVVDLLTDERILNVLDVAMRHAQGLATDDELDAARAAARAAAWYAARAAAWAAAQAAMAAARAAAQAAAMEAAQAAAWDAAMEAARDAARYAAWDAARAAASAAAQAAARAAAWAAAMEAASAAAQAAAMEAARYAARAAQIEIIKSMINVL